MLSTCYNQRWLPSPLIFFFTNPNFVLLNKLQEKKFKSTQRFRPVKIIFNTYLFSNQNKINIEA